MQYPIYFNKEFSKVLFVYIYYMKDKKPKWYYTKLNQLIKIYID